MGLTVTEREHWKERIGARIEKQINRIKMSSKELFDALKSKAREQAVSTLGIGELEQERAKLKEQAKRIERQEKLTTRKIVALVRGVDVSEVTENYYGGFDGEITGAIKKREEFELEKLFATTDEGKKILALRAEKDSLLDTVWLATSPAQVKELWQKLGAVLGDDNTPLQKEALQIKPVE